MSNTVVNDAEVKKIISGDYSLLRRAEPFLALLSRSGWHYLGLARFHNEIEFSSVDQMGEHLKHISGEYGSPQYNLMLNFLGFVNHLTIIHEDKYSLGSLKDNPLGLFVYWVAAHCLFSDLFRTQNMSAVDDKRKLEDIASLINSDVFEYSTVYTSGYTGPFSSLCFLNDTPSGVKDLTINQGDDIECTEQPLLSSSIENKKRTITAALFNWWKGNKIREYEWLPLQKGDVEIAKWCWGRIKAIQEKERIKLSVLPSLSNTPPLLKNSQNLIIFIDKICGEQYQLAVYAYFCFVSDPFIRKTLRTKISDQYRGKVFKDKNKGKIINVTVSETCKNGLDRLTKHHNKKQADILSELIEKACKELPQQGRP